jgi:hypothetical protein
MMFASHPHLTDSKTILLCEHACDKSKRNTMENKIVFTSHTIVLVTVLVIVFLMVTRAGRIIRL